MQVFFEISRIKWKWPQDRSRTERIFSAKNVFKPRAQAAQCLTDSMGMWFIPVTLFFIFRLASHDFAAQHLAELAAAEPDRINTRSPNIKSSIQITNKSSTARPSRVWQWDYLRVVQAPARIAKPVRDYRLILFHLPVVRSANNFARKHQINGFGESVVFSLQTVPP